MDANMSIDKKEEDLGEMHDGIDDEGDNSDTPDAEGVPPHQGDPAQPVKRKGGRKPIYATSEERKQRNRQAQAAFRERRTEYIKQLEDALRIMETNLGNLQSAHRTAADECLMLRYKNSLLERILLEKGIDVQAELRAKTGSPSLGPVHMPPNMVQPPTAHRAIMNRHHQARRSTSYIAPKIEPAPAHGNPSPQPRPTPVSHHSSPTANSPGYGAQTAMTPPGTDGHMQQRMAHPLKPQVPHGLANLPGAMMQQPIAPAVKSPGNGGPGIGGPATGAYYQTSYQDGAYNPQNAVDNQESNDLSGPGQYQQPGMGQRQLQAQTQHHQYGAGTQQIQAPQQQGQFGSINNMIYPFDATMDADPFGLSASMSFPTQFTFDTSNMR